MAHQPSEPGTTGTARRPGKKAIRYAVPVAVAAVAVASVGLVPALADGGDPDLPDITAQELVEKIAASDVEHLSGTVKISSDLGIPGLGGGSDQNGGLFGGHSERPEEDGGEAAPQDGTSPADPSARLPELVGGEHTLRVAFDGPDKQRVSVVEDTSEFTVVHNDGDLWSYDSASNTAFHAELPEPPKGRERGEGMPGSLTPQEAAEKALAAVDDTTSVTVDGTTKVAGRDAYVLAIAPEDAAESTVDALRIAVDAENGTPLRVTLDARSGGEPVLEAGYTKVDFGKPDADRFDFTPPKGAEVTEAEELKEHHSEEPGGLPGLDGFAELGEDVEIIGEGWDSVVRVELPEGAMGGDKGLESKEAQSLLDAFTEPVEGDFGQGRVVSTKLVNALLTDDGTLYVGAVTKDGLLKAAESD
ncbi:DUF2092 domain-containing protein [Streptomyces sp. JJ38]|uniref:LolA family protein n=1 Tax=Streptomyces sp. JJ38 TaxID=2738128 RepID=UPI001C560D9F|nr:DUF2092 domain-containing protein [Streptomyces sp. JJ38]MBW1600048.1 outer membrane lipoprotein carrier protein LolA [Streptomyces sp. JJ38]